MPDWSYRTVFRPLLFRLPPWRARDLALGAIGRLGSLPGGPAVIDFMGHMRPDERLKRSFDGLDLSSAVGLGAGLDPDGRALPAFARFGFGFIGVGPVTRRPLVRAPGERLARHDHARAIAFPFPPDNAGVDALAERLACRAAGTPPIVAHLAPSPEASLAGAVDDVGAMAGRLVGLVSAFAIEIPGSRHGDEDWRAFVSGVAAALQTAAPDHQVWLVVTHDLMAEEAAERVAHARSAGWEGVVMDGSVRDAGGWRQVGRPAREPSCARVGQLRTRFGPELLIVASGGVHEPADALALLDAGADLVEIDSGLVFSGPGLPKRVNEALLYRVEQPEVGGATAACRQRPAEQAWFWLFLLGAAMFVGSTIALAIAATRVVLPYDEHFVGLPRARLAAANPRLLPFMTHDRVTLAGSMVTIAVMYCGLARFGVRRGMHWARVAVEASAFVGFGTFFLFLGFGYFDPFHAFVTAVLLQLLLLGVHSRLSPPAPLPVPELYDTPAWRRALWGQLFFVVQAAAFIVAGVVIAIVGVTSVFVPEDLQYMHTDAHDLGAVSHQLLPLIAHDRATFGGMLLCSGLVFLMSALWGFRRGQRWLWWTTLAAGVPGYTAAIAVHYAVGYENLWHLTPAFAGAALFVTGLALSRPYLCGSDAAAQEAWGRLNRRDDAAAMLLVHGRGGCRSE